jgi:pyruvate formate lyase activating enzyme
VCPATALTIKGHYYPVDDLVSTLSQDKRFFDHSGGGVTFSGGEPTLHPDYLEQVLVRLKALDIHVVLQTCGHFDWPRFHDQLLPNIDLIYFDIKAIDAHRHRRWTGRSNATILPNLARLAASAPEKLVCSVPLVDCFTAQEDNIRAIASHIGAMVGVPYHLNAYHPGAIIKNAALGKTAPAALPQKILSPAAYRRIVKTFDAIVSHSRQERDKS